MFHLCDVPQECNLAVQQECNLAVQQDLPIVTSPPPLAAAAANNLQHTHKTECNSIQNLMSEISRRTLH